jgi:hypothetical protein
LNPVDENRPLTHGRDLHKYLDEIGAKQPDRAQALELLRGVQMGVQVDDARHLVRPITVPAGWYSPITAAGGVGFHSGCLLTSDVGSGFYLVGFYSVGAVTEIISEGIPAFAIGAAVTPMLVVSDEAPTTLVQTGIFTGPMPTDAIQLKANVPWPGCPIFVPRGRQIAIFNGTPDSSFNSAYGIQEIP